MTPQEPRSSFDVSAQYYDLLTSGDTEAAIADRIVGEGAVVVDVGAGTGRLALHLASTARAVVAMEPNRTMRAVALGRLADRPELMARVTVLPLAAEDDWRRMAPAMPSEGEVDAVLMLGVVHVLDADARRAAFRNASAWLAADGVLAISGVERPVPVDISLGCTRVGAVSVEGRLWTEERGGRWRTTVEYECSAGTETLWREMVSYDGSPPSPAEVAQELEAVDLRVAETIAVAGHHVIAARPVAH